ncbi:DUF305 domain-containing protein [Cupriavidus oxalaticus]|jgi:hypothetical protein|uniref:DUF305 domain-containing protein n=1 Tax=Cupriavidus oxalaticus TaxID=96344 RepID=A0A5P3VAA1_9BURK|nr:DUF305 domain-containing protein [Cupriavidus oxalaticus]QEZ42878.1 DUF305 domain-containing protein [Cupriavidus oxalaticus]
MKLPLPAFMLAALAATAGSACLAGGVPAVAHDHGRAPVAQHTEPFVASTAKPFAQRMDDAMAVMDAGMRAAAMNGEPDHDFVAMMIPHHQGAIDMAKALLLDTRDPELRNLAQGIITDQQNEIRLMQAWLARHPKPAPGLNPAPADSR